MANTLSEYLSNTKLQLQNPGSGASKIYTDADLTTYINLARSQLAGEAECIRNYATVPAPANGRVINFSAIVLTAPSTGIQGVFNIRQALLQVGSGLAILTVRGFPWFNQYHMNKIVPIPDAPKEWSQYGQGVSGSIYVDPIPDQDYTLSIDCVCYPVDLVDDTTVEAIPYPWTDVVPFYAAWYALTSAQRQADADKMMERVKLYMQRARGISNPDIIGRAFSQPGQDPTTINRLGARTPKQSAGGQ